MTDVKASPGDPHSPSSPSLPKVLPELLAGGKFHGHTCHTHCPGLSHAALLHSDPGLAQSISFAPGGAEIIAICSGTVKFLLPDLFWDVIKTFHGQLCQKK